MIPHFSQLFLRMWPVRSVLQSWQTAEVFCLDHPRDDKKGPDTLHMSVGIDGVRV